MFLISLSIYLFIFGFGLSLFFPFNQFDDPFKSFQSDAAYENVEVEAIKLANSMEAEYWAVSSKTGGLPYFFPVL